MAQHDLKIYPQFWRELVAGRKPFEVRRDDRNFRVGDTVSLKEYDPKVGFTGAGPEAAVEIACQLDVWSDGPVIALARDAI